MLLYSTSADMAVLICQRCGANYSLPISVSVSVSLSGACSMLTQYDELRAARGRTLALEHDTTQELGDYGGGGGLRGDSSLLLLSKGEQATHHTYTPPHTHIPPSALYSLCFCHCHCHCHCHNHWTDLRLRSTGVLTVVFEHLRYLLFCGNKHSMRCHVIHDIYMYLYIGHERTPL
jgi:hypothetical protein